MLPQHEAVELIDPYRFEGFPQEHFTDREPELSWSYDVSDGVAPAPNGTETPAS